MAGSEDEPEQVVADLVVHRVVDRGAAVRGLHHLDVATEQLDLPGMGVRTTVAVDRLALRGGHQPPGGVGGNPRAGPVLQRGEQGVLRRLLGQTEVTGDARQASDQATGLDPPHRLDRSPGRSGGLPDRHDGPSKQVTPTWQSRATAPAHRSAQSRRREPCGPVSSRGWREVLGAHDFQDPRLTFPALPEIPVQGHEA